MVKLNSLVIEESIWSGLYFSDVPITIKAIAREGYRFSHWSGSVDSQDPELTVMLSQSITLKANFEPVEGNQEPIVINEINYNSDRDLPTGDWLELYNPNPYAVNIGNWIFKDGNEQNIFRFSEFQDIAARGYLVICRDLNAFSQQYPDLNNAIGSFDFGLSSTSDMVRIYNSQGVLQDQVNYSSVAPWPTTANGSGATLELISPDLDNNLPENWGSINTYGSPGRANTLPTAIDEVVESSIRVYPNPVSNELNIITTGASRGIVEVQVIDLLGTIKLEKTLSPETSSIDLSTLPDGAYVIRIIPKDGTVQSTRIIKH